MSLLADHLDLANDALSVANARLAEALVALPHPSNEDCNVLLAVLDGALEDAKDAGHQLADGLDWLRP